MCLEEALSSAERNLRAMDCKQQNPYIEYKGNFAIVFRTSNIRGE